MTRDELSHYLDELLQCATFQDYAPNGLQIEGRKQVKLICTAVTASLDAVTAAVAANADALLVHHGYFWKGENPVLTSMKRERIRQILQHDLNLYAFHLPLDCHTTLGNNACLAKALDVKNVKSHTVDKIPNLLWTGEYMEVKDADAVKLSLTQFLNQQPIHIDVQKPIKNIAWCSGAAQDYIELAYKLGADAYISGEISERTYYQAKELSIHYFAAGHHATERFGIQALGEHLANQFGLDHQFIDSINPI